MGLVRSDAPMRRWTLAAAIGMVLVPELAQARTPLPTIEVVQPRKRVRLLDVRGAVQLGGGLGLGERAPQLALGYATHVSFVELSETMHLHAAFGTSGLVDLHRGWSRRRGLSGADVGLGLTSHVRGGPAFVVTATAGPRWSSAPSDAPDDPEVRALERWRVDGWGVIGQMDAYPFYVTIPKIVADVDRGRRFYRYVLSGLHLWAAVRYDVLRTGSRTPTMVAGGGFDLGRTLLLPILLRGR